MPSFTLYKDHFPWLNDSPEKVRANKLQISLIEDELCRGKQITDKSRTEAFLAAGSGDILEKEFYEKIKQINLRKVESLREFATEISQVNLKLATFKIQKWQHEKVV